MADTTHPFSQLSVEEIRTTAAIVSKLHPDANLIFKSITLAESAKAATLRYLEAEHRGLETRPNVDRCSFVAYYKKGHVRITICRCGHLASGADPVQDILHEALVDLSTKQPVSNKALDRLLHGPGDLEEGVMIEVAVKKDEQVRRELENLQIPDPDLVVIELWIYGTSLSASSAFGIALNTKPFAYQDRTAKMTNADNTNATCSAET